MEPAKRRRSRKACVVCHQRKIKCDLDHHEDTGCCTNCRELGTTCTLYVRKPRVKKYQIQQNLKVLLNKSSFENMNNIHIDPMAVFSKHVLKNEYYKLSSGFNVGLNALKFQGRSLDLPESFLNNFEGQRLDMVLLNRTDMDYLGSVGCFSLPSIELCQAYINDFFDLVHVKVPFIDRDRFFAEHTDLTNPPSLLLLQSMFCIAAKVAMPHYGGDGERETQLEIATLLYKRATLLLEFGFEKDPFRSIQALSFLSLVNFNDDLSAFWRYFQSIDYFGLSITDKCLYRKMYWHWRSKFSFHTFLASNQVKRFEGRDFIRLTTLTKEDFAMDKHITDTKRTALMAKFHICLVLDQLNELSLRADILASNNVPFDHLTRAMDYVFWKWYSGLDSCLQYKIDDKSTQNETSALLTGAAYVMLLSLHSKNLARYNLMQNMQNSRAAEITYMPSMGVLLFAVLMSYAIFSRFKLSKLMFPASIDFESCFFVNFSRAIALFLECDDAHAGNTTTWPHASVIKELSTGIRHISKEFYRLTLQDKFREEKMNLVTVALQDPQLRVELVRRIMEGSERLQCSIDDFNFKYPLVDPPPDFDITNLFQLNGFSQTSSPLPSGKMSITTLVADSDVLIENHISAHLPDLTTRIHQNWSPAYSHLYTL